MQFFTNIKSSVITWIFVFLAVSVSIQNPVLAECICRGDNNGDNYVTPMDVFACVTLLNHYNHVLGTGEYRAPASEAPCLDVADANGVGLEGGDGWIDIGDLNYMAEVVTSYCSTIPPYLAPCLPTSFTTTGGAEILVSVNGNPWDEVSPVSPGDIIKVFWIGTDTFENCDFYNGGFSNFNLNVSKGEYLNDFQSTVTMWTITDVNAAPDGQGGINVGGGAYSGGYNGDSPLGIFSFSFRVPDVNGPAYTVDVRPNQGSWRLIQHDQYRISN